MRLKLILPVVEVKKYKHPRECPYECGGKEFILPQTVIKKVCDTTHEEVEARRYKCLSCQRTFRVYPQQAIFAKSNWYGSNVVSFGVELRSSDIDVGSLGVIHGKDDRL